MSEFPWQKFGVGLALSVMVLILAFGIRSGCQNGCNRTTVVQQ